MQKFDILSLDLKALTLLCRIHEAGSLSLAAERSGIAQSTASHALDRLRRALDDPLFHRSLGGSARPRVATTSWRNCARSSRRCARLVPRPRISPATARRSPSQRISTNAA
ncbi:hypothetical protein C4N9_10250 [Pararhodobacter marinus]|uniref:HTH lysR-type domain-containing protein n=1 Tax=Pararhodobacter marinus TaxID=2184063 RepID=A0A2U2CBD8_9RHOB|nr:hypothetical protein C4N9_10250 [Pararhodobacter marinus]